MSELGIFIDESGTIDGKNSNKDGLKDYYIVSFLFHDKSIDVSEDIKILENYLRINNLNFNLPIHIMPLIRQQKPYQNLSISIRKKIFHQMFQFMRKLKLKYKTFVCDKKYSNSKQNIKNILEKYIEQLIKEHFDYFNKFDEIVIYYDEGQEYLSKILHNSFPKNINTSRFKENVNQSNYRILQCADLVCALELIMQRKQNNEYIKSIDKFFTSGNKFNKNYGKAYKNLEL